MLYFMLFHYVILYFDITLTLYSIKVVDILCLLFHYIDQCIVWSI